MPRPWKNPARPVKPWENFEQAVASVQRLLSPDAEVTHNEKIPDLKNRRRQFDVVIRGNWAGHKILGVIECKDKGRPVDMPQIEGFITKSRSVRANIALIVSRSGFSGDAISLAKDNGIGTLSLLPDENANAGFLVGVQSYVRIFEWSHLQVVIFFEEKAPLDEPLDIDSIRYANRKVVDWFKKKLANEHRRNKNIGWLKCVVEFDEPKSMIVNSHTKNITSIHFLALRKVQTKTKFLTISGQAFYDWQNNSWQWPPGGFITTGMIKPDYSDWDDFDGEIPDPPEGSFAMNMDVYRESFDPNTEVIDLESI
jgi:hypothetical protein